MKEVLIGILIIFCGFYKFYETGYIEKIESLSFKIDSLNEEINYLKGLEDECFPVAME